MRKAYVALLISLATVTTVGVTVGLSLAAYKAPEESNTYQFGSMDPSDNNFQPISYYFADGSGTEGDPYIIKNSHQLRNLSKLQNSGVISGATYFSLGTSFQYEGDALEPIGTTTYPFTGVFNGCNFSITKLTVETSSLTNVGMFGVVGSSTATGTVRQLILAGPSVTYTGTSAVNIGLVAGKKETSGQTSVIEDIEIYGGTSNFKLRAHLKSGGTPTCGNGIVGTGGSTRAGFVSTLDHTSYSASPKTYTSVTTTSHYYLWLNGSTVTNSN